jgi:uncharacterized protein YjdB/PKD repeat protein
MLEVRVSTSADDAEERADGSMYITSSDLELVRDGGDQTVGMRFAGLAIPQDASISAAYVRFQVDETRSVATFLAIEGEAADDAVTFGGGALDISSRTRTNASVPWEPPPWSSIGEAGLDQRTPDIAAVVQEVVSRPGWSSGNALVLIITGSGKRTAEAWDGVPAAAPLLHVEYLTAPAASVDVTPAAATVGVGTTRQLTATPRDADGSPAPRPVTWSSGDEAIATVSAEGLVTGVAPGTATITAEADGVSGTAAINVVDVPVASVEVRVSTSADDAEEAADGSMYITSSDLELVRDSEDQTVGMRFTGLAIPGDASISAAYVQFQVDEGTSETTVLAIEGEAADDAVIFGGGPLDISSRTRTHASVRWEPPPWSSIGEAGLDQRTPDIAEVVQEVVSRPGWSSGNALVLIITGSGRRTAAAWDGVPSAAPLLHVEYVTAPVASVDVTPAAALVGEGATEQLTATPRDADGNPLSRAVSWSSGDEAVATVSAEGLVTGVAAGTATITAQTEGVSGTAVINVVYVPVASVEVQPTSATIATGATLQLDAILLDPDDVPLPGRPVTWWSSDEAVATVSDAGLVTGLGEGTVTITAASEGKEGTSVIDVFVPPPGITTPNLKVAFIGDQGWGPDALNVLQLIGDEGADMVIHSGDLDYVNDPVLFDSNVTSVLGADYPYFVSAGNHDTEAGIWYGVGGYQEKLQQRLDLIPDAYCTGDLGVNSWCRYQGLFFILSGIGTIGVDSEEEAFIRSALEADASDWRICSWHANQSAMQVGGKGNAVGWIAYETCLELGAIIATAHEHSYSRTKTLTSTELQIVDPAWPEPDNLSVRPGATFVFVSGLGGASIRPQLRCLPTTYPYGCNGEWASIYTTDQAAQFGALFIEFYVDGNPRKARGYFKNVAGEVIDQFTVWSGAPVPNNVPVAMDDGHTTDEDVTLNVATPGVLGNDTDADGDPLTAVLGTDVTNGTLTLGSDGSFTYVPNADFFGTDGFTYVSKDGTDDSNVATVTITVTGVNDAPVADAGGPYAGTVDVAVTFDGSGSADVDGTIVSYAWDFGEGNTGSGAGPSHTYVTDGTFTVSLTVTDDGGATDTATESVTVTAAALTVTDIVPNTVDAGSFINATISGSGFAPGVVVTVENGSGPAPDISNVVWESDVEIRARFTAKSGGPPRDRPWDVRITNPDGTSVALVGGLIVSGAR